VCTKSYCLTYVGEEGKKVCLLLDFRWGGVAVPEAVDCYMSGNVPRQICKPSENPCTGHWAVQENPNALGLYAFGFSLGFFEVLQGPITSVTEILVICVIIVVILKTATSLRDCGRRKRKFGLRIVTKIVEIWKILCGDSFRFLLASNRFQGGVIWRSDLYRGFRYFVKFRCQRGHSEKLTEISLKHFQRH